MSDYKVALDSHKRYSIASVLDAAGKKVHHTRLEHEPGSIQAFCQTFPPGTPVALETVGHWYWIVDEIEAGGCLPLMAHARKAKVMMGHVDKFDRLDADGLATLLHNGTLPTVWIPPASVRDERELPRTRMAFSRLRTALKNRLHATLGKYHLSPEDVTDIFGAKSRPALEAAIASLPPETQRCASQELNLLDQVGHHILQLEARIRQRMAVTPSLQLLDTLPGVADILAIVIDREVGSIARFPSPLHFASYAGSTPRIHASGGKVRFGPMRQQANHYLKWAFIEAASTIALVHQHPRWARRHIAQLYTRIRRRKGHGVAVGAVARHLAEATFWILTRQQPYREPALPRGQRA